MFEDEMTVRSKYPLAHVLHFKPVYVMGSVRPYQDQRFEVYANPGDASKLLGAGRSKRSAWARAAERVRAEAAAA